MIPKGHEENLCSGELDMFIILIMVMISRVNIYVKIHQIEHFMCKFYMSIITQ